MAYPTRVIGSKTTYPTWISNPQVNSGALIDLHAQEMRCGVEVFTSVKDVAASAASDTWTNKLSRGINTGFANPQYTIPIVYDLTTTHTTGSGCGIDWEHLQSLIVRSDQYMTLYDRGLITTSNVNGTAKVMLKNVSWNRSTKESDEGYMVYPTLTFVEVK